MWRDRGPTLGGLARSASLHGSIRLDTSACSFLARAWPGSTERTLPSLVQCNMYLQSQIRKPRNTRLGNASGVLPDRNTLRCGLMFRPKPVRLRQGAGPALRAATLMRERRRMPRSYSTLLDDGEMKAGFQCLRNRHSAHAASMPPPHAASTRRFGCSIAAIFADGRSAPSWPGSAARRRPAALPRRCRAVSSPGCRTCRQSRAARRGPRPSAQRVQ